MAADRYDISNRREEQKGPQELRGEKGRQKPSPWELGGLTWSQLGKRVWSEMDTEHDDVFGRSAELAYYFFLAVFPGLIFLLSILGLVLGSNPAVEQTLVEYVHKGMPGEAAGIIQQQLQRTTNASSSWTLLVGIVGALWSASAGISSLMTVMNFAYGVKEGRPWWRARLIRAPLLTIALTALLVTALAIFLFGGNVANWAGNHGLGQTAVTFWRVVQWPMAFFFVVLAFAMLYRYAPDIKDQKWHWLTPGSVIAVGLWVVASIFFRIYVQNFSSYSSTYGSVAAVIILMLWFYITSLALLVGAEINAEIEHAAAKRGREDARLKGEKEAPAA